MANRLANETSPYLLQHKDNPVDWFPWGPEAFKEARLRDRPILLSVGYSACHWCHVMAHESFENSEIAAVMNSRFINIKVDREERPDIDSIYMQAVQSLTGRGGWPMTVFLMPDGRPFFGGTYFPPEDRHGMPGFPRVLDALSDFYRTRKPEIERTAGQIQTQLSAYTSVQASDDGAVTEALLQKAYEGIVGSYDMQDGGFGAAPKFPQPMALEFLLRYHHRTRQPAPLVIVEQTLRKMAQGGMYDQVGGGFHRYSTDAVWLVPHFEKMLYDNALLAGVYLDAFRITGDGFYRRICEGTLDYVLREMTDASGAFYSTQDADSEGEEGKFFLWTPAELEVVLGGDAALIGEYFDVTVDGNFEGKNILHVEAPREAFAAEHGLTQEDFSAMLARAQQLLYDARERRVHPGRDEKVLTGWNGMMLRSFAKAAAALGSDAYREAAVRNADFLLSAMSQDGRLLRTWKEGTARLNGYLEDYACLVDGLLATHEATFDLKYLKAAIDLARDMLRLFWDEEAGALFDTGSDHETLITRPRDFWDNATPSGTSVAADVLLRLAAITGEPEFGARAAKAMAALATFTERSPLGFGRLLSAMDFHLSRTAELALVWGGAPAPSEMTEVVFGAFRPNLVTVGAAAGSGSELTPLLQERPAIGGQPTAYVCEQFVCQAPTTDAAELRRLLDTPA